MNKKKVVEHGLPLSYLQSEQGANIKDQMRSMGIDIKKMQNSTDPEERKLAQELIKDFQQKIQ